MDEKGTTLADPLSTSDNAAAPERWDKEITPHRGLLAIPWRELWRYRGLIMQLARRDLAAQYKQTVLGPFWFVIQPLLATVVFSFLFGRMARLGTEHIPHFLFYMGGLVPWAFFADAVNKTSHTFTRNAAMFSKVYFPRLAVPLAQLLTNLATFSVQFTVFLIGLGYYLWKAKFAYDPTHPFLLDPNWRIAFFPILLLQSAMLGLGVGLTIAALSKRYRDLALATGFFVQLWMYASSVVFPLSRIQEVKLRGLLAMNPMVPVIEAFRFAFLGEGMVTRAQLATSFAVSAAVLFFGLVIFSRTEQSVVDTL